MRGSGGEVPVLTSELLNSTAIPSVMETELGGWVWRMLLIFLAEVDEVVAELHRGKAPLVRRYQLCCVLRHCFG